LATKPDSAEDDDVGESSTTTPQAHARRPTRAVIRLSALRDFVDDDPERFRQVGAGWGVLRRRARSPAEPVNTAQSPRAPDATRSCPLPQLLDSVHRALHERVAELTFMVPLGTHAPMSTEQLAALLGYPPGRPELRHPGVTMPNHEW
jgi:hypothetical protein